MQHERRLGVYQKWWWGISDIDTRQIPGTIARSRKLLKSETSPIFKYQNSLNSLALKDSLVNSIPKETFLEFHLYAFCSSFLLAQPLSQSSLFLLHGELFLCTGHVMNSHLPMGTVPMAGKEEK